MAVKALARNWCALSDMAWCLILEELSWKDISNSRSACRAWRRDVDRCLQRLHLRDPSPDCLSVLGRTFSCLSTVKLTATQREDIRLDAATGLPGCLGRAGSLRLRSKRPGGSLLVVGRLQLLAGAGGLLTTLCLRACEVHSWQGLQTCRHLSHLQLVHCRFSEKAAQGLVAALADLPLLAALDIRTGHLHPLRDSARLAFRTATAHQHAHAHNQTPGHQHQQHQLQHPSHTLVNLRGLAESAPRVAVLRLAAPLPEAQLQLLLHVELPGLSQLQELDLELHPARQHPVRQAHGAPGAPGAAAAAPAEAAAAAAGHPIAHPHPHQLQLQLANLHQQHQQQHPHHQLYDRELTAILPAVCAAAPQLTSLRVKGHTRLGDRELLLLRPLRHLRHLSLDLPHLDVQAHAHHAAAQPQLQAQQPQPLHAQVQAGAPAGLPPSPPVSAAAVSALLAALPDMQSLSLAHVSWTAEALRALGSSALDLSSLRLAGTESPKGLTLCHFLADLRCLPVLEELDLSGCAQLSDWGLAVLGRCAGRLTRLRLSGCGELAGDVGVAALAPLMRKMRRLDLSFMDKLTDRGLAGLLRLGGPALGHLSLNFCCKVTDAGLHTIAAACPALTHLDVEHCPQLTAAGASALRGLRELRRVSAEGCGSQVLAALAGTPAARPRHSRMAARWWLAAGSTSDA